MLTFLSQAQVEPAQTEYFVAYALIIGMVVLGLLVVCIPRPRTKHFVEPEEAAENSKQKKKKMKRKKK